MHIVLLSGGSGRRLWPLSNEVRSKQFLKLFPAEGGAYESMIQRVFRKIRAVLPGAEVTVATSGAQVPAVRNQLGKDVDISIEPCRRDTFPAIALAAAYLLDVKGAGEEEPLVICPVDPYVDDGYFAMLGDLAEMARRGEANISLMGIEPTYPSEKYGYILPETGEEISGVSAFAEKPTAKRAAEYISRGALWNGGVFACRLGYLREKTAQLTGLRSYDELYEKYAELEPISFDYAVVEKEERLRVKRFAGDWKDIGTWNTLTESLEDAVIGEGVMSGECDNVHIINDLDVPVLAMGLHDVVISASPEGILVADKGQSSYIKPYADSFARQVMFAEKSWGSYRVMDVESDALTIKVTLNPGHSMNYHSHQRRDEVWVVISGEGRTIIDGEERPVRPGDVITMAAGCRHTVIADSELKLIEVQLGEEISAEDKIKHGEVQKKNDLRGGR